MFELVVLLVLSLTVIYLLILWFYIPWKSLAVVKAYGIKLGWRRLVDMRLRRVPKEEVENFVEALVMAKQAGINVSIDELEAHYYSGGDVIKVMEALVIARNASFELSFSRVASFSLVYEKEVTEVVRQMIDERNAK